MSRAIVSGIPVIWYVRDSIEARKLVIWLPGFSGSKEAVREQLLDLAHLGFVALSFDPCEHGERRTESQEALRARVVGNLRRYFWPILAQTAEESRLVIDWAIDALGVEPEVGIGGISMGGDIAVTVAGLDERTRAVAAAIATPDWLRPGSFEAPGEPDAVAQACYERCNPLTHLDHYRSRPAISFQCGAVDRQVPPDGAQRFAKAIQDLYTDCPDRLRVDLHEGVGHQFTEAMWQNAVTWFEQHLGKVAAGDH